MPKLFSYAVNIVLLSKILFIIIRILKNYLLGSISNRPSRPLLFLCLYKLIFAFLIIFIFIIVFLIPNFVDECSLLIFPF